MNIKGWHKPDISHLYDGLMKRWHLSMLCMLCNEPGRTVTQETSLPTIYYTALQLCQWKVSATHIAPTYTAAQYTHLVINTGGTIMSRVQESIDGCTCHRQPDMYSMPVISHAVLWQMYNPGHRFILRTAIGYRQSNHVISTLCDIKTNECSADILKKNAFTLH